MVHPITSDDVISDSVVLVGDEEEIKILEVSERLLKMPRVVEKRPLVLSGNTYVRRADGKKWYFTVTEKDGKPYELFVNTNARDSSATIKNALEKIEGLVSQHVDSIFLEAQRFKSKHQTNSAKLCRTISLALRHGIPVEKIVDELENVDHNVSHLTFHIMKILSMYIKNVTVSVCPICKSDSLISENGCKHCAACGWERC
jgi:ribonucleoside-diphosphate reductase alpha chain